MTDEPEFTDEEKLEITMMQYIQTNEFKSFQENLIDFYEEVEYQKKYGCPSDNFKKVVEWYNDIMNFDGKYKAEDYD